MQRLGVSRTQTIVCLAVAILLSATLAAVGLTQRPVFVARATLYFKEPEDRSSALTLNSLSAISSLVGLGTDSQLWAEQEIGKITSRTNLNRLVTKHNLKRKLIEQRILRGSPEQLDDPEYVAKSLRNIIEFMPRSKTHWVDVAVSTPDRSLSQYIATNLLEDYATDRRRELVDQSERNLKYLQTKLAAEPSVAVQSVTVKLISEEMARTLFLLSERGKGMLVIDAPFTAVTPKRIPYALVGAGALMLLAIISWTGLLLCRWMNGFRAHSET